MKKVTDQEILEALENAEYGASQEQIASQLNITQQALSKRLKKIDTSEVRDYARVILERQSVNLVRDLLEQSKQGKTQATVAALEYAKKFELDNVLTELQKDIAELKEQRKREIEERKAAREMNIVNKKVA